MNEKKNSRDDHVIDEKNATKMPNGADLCLWKVRDLVDGRTTNVTSGTTIQ